MKTVIKLEEGGLFLLSIILLGHSCMDRAMGYGLKYSSGFSDTHLGKIGKAAKTERTGS